MHVCQIKQEGSKLIRLWVHEVYRVFSDRLIEEKDKVAFFEIVKTRTKDMFQKNMDDVSVWIVLHARFIGSQSEILEWLFE